MRRVICIKLSDNPNFGAFLLERALASDWLIKVFIGEDGDVS